MAAGRGDAYRADAAASARDALAASPEVVFYQLARKFVDSESSVPDDAQDILYYTLAVGHHTGVIDCFEERLRMPLDVYEQLVACFPEGAARYKLEAIMRHWEIQIDSTNLEVLVPAFEDLKKGPAAGLEADGVREVFDGLCGMLAVLQANSAAYIMGRIRRQ